MATHFSILAWKIPWTAHGVAKESDTTQWLNNNRNKVNSLPTSLPTYLLLPSIWVCHMMSTHGHSFTAKSLNGAACLNGGAERAGKMLLEGYCFSLKTWKLSSECSFGSVSGLFLPLLLECRESQCDSGWNFTQIGLFVGEEEGSGGSIVYSFRKLEKI